MARTTFHGDIATDSHEVVIALLRDGLVRPELSMAVRRKGFEATCRDDTIGVYCYEAGAPDSGDSFSGDSFSLLEEVVEAEPARAAERPTALADACLVAGLGCSIDDAEVDASGAAIGVESTVE
ncbi:hypothetical protein ACFVU3_28985 [Streptomyces sp. NPDC058052]|uniref:hypothetical protein n=1 Tax=Streptomyces sp. NPDC058052 TaxID=3346316 RepID=UPI0036EAB864